MKAQASDAGVEDLLRDVDSTLSGTGAKSKKPSRNKVKKQTDDDDESNVTQRKKSMESEPPKPTEEAPLPNNQVGKILNLEERDQEAIERYREPILAVGLSAGILRLKPVYDLSQDDDDFTPNDVSKLYGANIEASARWSILALSGNMVKTHFISRFTIGYFQRQIPIHRTGAIDTVFDASVTDVPLSLSFGLRTHPLSTYIPGLSIEALYGVAAEFYNQSGTGYYDSVSGFFFGDAFTARLSYRPFESVSVFAAWQPRGIAATPDSHRINDQLCVGGIDIQLPN